ncbi:MAG: hypothetical protein JWR83_2406 [Aeromicrobium sp.]|nr:hypothetical protein [Aeromicrobium sp.]
MEELTAGRALEGCSIAVGPAHAYLLAGRTGSGEVDHQATRAAAERLALAYLCGDFCTGRSLGTDELAPAPKP